MSCTVKDIARQTGVSTATVSRVLNGAENVSCETRTRVLSAVSRLQYSPNLHAAQLARANGGISRKRGISAPTPARMEGKTLSGPGVDRHNEHGNAKQLRVLREENVRLRRARHQSEYEVGDIGSISKWCEQALAERQDKA